MRINSNIFSLTAQRMLAQTTKALARSMDRLASGKRVNFARDDAAALAIGNGLEAQKRGMLQAIRNINDARGFLNTAEGAMTVQAEIVQRMRELAIQAANGTLSDNARGYLNSEMQALLEEFNRIGTQTDFNGTKLLDGTFKSTSLQVGTKKSDTIDFSISPSTAQSLFSADVTTSSDTLGTGTFEAATTFSMGAGMVKIFTQDFDGDGNMDLLTGNVTSPDDRTFNISLGNGDGTFQTRTSFDLGGTGPKDIAVEDFNGDGKLDVMGLTGNAGAAIHFGVGNGTFQAPAYVSFSSGITRSLSAADLNNDEKMDFVVSGFTSNSMLVFIGNGDGTFAAMTTFASQPNPTNMTLADYNNDGNIDISVVDNGATHNITTHLGNGDGTFQAGTTYSVTQPYGLVTLDANEDGNTDLVATNGGSTSYLILGNGNGTFASPQTIGSGLWFSRTVDLNADGHIDLIGVGVSGNNVNILFGNGNGTFQAAVTYVGATSPTYVTTADFDGDGNLDIATAGSTAAVFLQETTGGEVTTTLTAADADIGTQSRAENTLSLLTSVLGSLNSLRANIGAIQSRLDFAEASALILSENVSASQSRILDADYAEEMAEFTRLKVLQQAGVSVLSQANISMQLTLDLLKNL